MSAETIVAAVEAMAGDAGWWHPSNAERYAALARRLTAAGVPEAVALDVLAEARAVVADEYGE